MSPQDKAAEALRLAQTLNNRQGCEDEAADMLREYAALLQAQPAEAQRLEAENEALKKDAAAFEWLLNVPASAVHDISLRQWLWKRPWGPDKMRAMIARAMTKGEA